MSEVSYDEHPLEQQQKNLWEVNNNNKLLCLIFLKYIFELMINTAWPASNSVYKQNFTEKNDIKYKNFPT